MPPDRGEQVPKGTQITATQPPTMNGGDDIIPNAGKDDLFVQAREQGIIAAGAAPERDPDELKIKLRKFVQEAESVYQTYGSFVQKSWGRAYRAFQNRHFDSSKYLSDAYKARSSLFVPKTRAAIRKTMAANAASLFSTTDALAISAGNDSDEQSRAAAALMQEVINYRTDRTSGRNAIKWFLTCMGAVQDATLTGVVCSIQSWKLETQKVGEQPITQEVEDPQGGPPLIADVLEVDKDGNERPAMAPILKVVTDRPESVLIPPEQLIIDAGADWRDPAQTASFFGIKWPMTMDEIRQKEKDPRNPWNSLSEGVLRGAMADSMVTAQAKGVRSARDGGRDRYDQSNRPSDLGTIWVTQWFIRCDGQDMTFFSLSQGEHFLTEPKPTEEIYPWNKGERPITFGYGSLESHKIFPMSPAESWQPLQTEINDLVNLTLDTVKMTIAPITKIKRGSSVDLAAMRVRGPGTNILMSNPAEDVVFEKPPGVDPGAWQQRERLNNDFDGLAGQFDSSSVQSNRQLNETVGGMKILTGAANALGEFDQRIIIETWAEPTLGQIVKLCQYYEHDATVLGLCGDRAKLWQKHGVDQITDELLDAQVTVRIDIGVGAGDPQMRLQKFTMATQAAMLLLQNHPKFVRGELELDVEAIMQECYGSAGYRDGGKRFVTKGPAQPNQGPPENPDVIKAKGDVQLKKEAQDAKIKLDSENAGREFELKRKVAGIEALLKREAQHAELRNQAENAQQKLHLDTDVQRMSMEAQHGLEREKFGKAHELDREKMAAGHGLEREKFAQGHTLEQQKAMAGHALQRDMADRGHELETQKFGKSHELEQQKASAGHNLQRDMAGKGHELERERFAHETGLADKRFKSEEGRAEGKFKGEEGRAERKAKLQEKTKTAKTAEKASKEKSTEAKIAEVKRETAELQAAVVDALKDAVGDKELVKDKDGKTVGIRPVRRPKDKK